MKSGVRRLLAGAERAFSGRAPRLEGIRNLLLVQHPLALGTAIHATPLVSVLKAAVPDAQLIAVASGFAEGVLRGNPGLERVVSTPNPIADLRGAIRAIRDAKLFEGEPFVSVHTLGNGRTRVVAAMALSGGHTRVGFTVHPEWAQICLGFDPTLSQIDNNLGIVAALGHGPGLQAALARDSALKEPVVYPSEADFARVQGILAAKGITETEPIAVFITQTSPTQRKSWRPERFQRVAEMLGREYGAQVVFGGTAGEAAAIEALRSGLNIRNASLAGETSLLEMAALFGLADVVLTLDTGPLHLARAMNLPMVIIAPAWSPPVEWLPVNNPRARILKNLDLPTAPPDYVIDEVSAEEAEAALRELLALYPPRMGVAADPRS